MAVTAAHGGKVFEAARELGLAPEAILDFSANLNPLGPPQGVLEAIQRSLPGSITAYPDDAAPALVNALARRHGVGAEHVVLGAGGAALLHLALEALRPAALVVPRPCFSEQAKALVRYGVQPRWLDLAPGFRLRSIHLNGLAGLGWLLTNPHNPSGQLLRRAWLAPQLAELNPETLLLDEAFMDYAPAESLAAIVLQRPRTVVLRSLTKFYAMPGLRVGYALADAATAALMRSLQCSWPVTQLALEAALAALHDDPYDAATRECFARSLPPFRRALQSLGLKVWPSAGPFLLVRLPGPVGPALASRLRAQGILIRTCEGWEGLGPHFIRLAVKEAEAHARLLDALTSALGREG